MLDYAPWIYFNILLSVGIDLKERKRRRLAKFSTHRGNGTHEGIHMWKERHVTSHYRDMRALKEQIVTGKVC